MSFNLFFSEKFILIISYFLKQKNMHLNEVILVKYLEFYTLESLTSQIKFLLEYNIIHATNELNFILSH